MDDPKGFIKVYRRLLDWEWYSDANTTKLFLHCLLKANWEEKKWHGITILPGQFVTSLPALAAESGLSIQEVRTALMHLESTGELTGNSTESSTGKKIHRGRLITVSNWENYQGATGKSTGTSTDKSTSNQQAINRQSTATKELKEYKELKEDKRIGAPPESFIEEDLSDEELEAEGWTL